MRIDSRKILLEVKSYLKQIITRKAALLLGGIISLILFLLSNHFLFEGFNKRFFIYTLLCLLTGALIILPRLKKWYLSLPLIVFYLLFVPRRLFYRTELPVHDLSALLDGTVLANLLIIYLIYAVLFLILQRVELALGSGGILLLIGTIANYYVKEFRGTSLTLSDLSAVGTAATVMHSYTLEMSSELWYSILYYIFFIALGFWCAFPYLKGLRYHIIVTLVSLTYIGGFWIFWDKSDYLEKHDLQGIHWMPSLNQSLEGFLLNFAINMREMHMSRPLSYSESALKKIAADADASYQPADVQALHPNIIIIMNEGWSELKVLGNLEVTAPYMDYVESMEENTIKGMLTVNIFGGLTANTEFEVLTGDTLSFLAPTAVPYQLQVNHKLSSLARVLGEQGYQTMAMHPSILTAWNRSVVYDNMGFEEFIDIYKFQTEYGYVRGYISDECNFNEIIWQFEHKRENTPLFLFDVTIQNHGGYEGITSPVSVEKIGSQNADTVEGIDAVTGYLNLVNITDYSFKNLIEYFETVEEPVIVCMFGDHQPALSEEFYDAIFADQEFSARQQEELKYIVPYVIWTNYDAELQEYGDMSANYLGAVVLECAGAELPPYYKYLLNMREQYPIISNQTITEIGSEDIIKGYRMLQYNQLMEKDYLKVLFSLLP